MSWFDTGFDNVDKEESRQRKKYGPSRLYLKGGTSKEIVLIDDEPVLFYEHNPKLNGNYRNWLTCLQNFHDDVVCCRTLGNNTRYYCGYLTVVDCEPWTDDQGKLHQFDIKLCQGKIKTLKRWRRKKEEHGSIAGSLFKVTREDKKSPSCGDEWTWKREADLSKLFEHVKYKGTLLSELWNEAEQNTEKMKEVMETFSVQPNEDGKLPRVIPAFNYEQLLKPKTPDEVKFVLAGYASDHADRPPAPASNGASAPREDSVPF